MVSPRQAVGGKVGDHCRREPEQAIRKAVQVWLSSLPLFFMLRVHARELPRFSKLVLNFMPVQ